VGVPDDGAIGPATMAAVTKADPAQALVAFGNAKEAFYKAIVERDPTQAKFIKGWLNRVASVEKFAGTMMA